MKKKITMFTLMFLVLTMVTSWAIASPEENLEPSTKNTEEKQPLDSKGVITNSQLFQSLDEKISYLLLKGNEFVKNDQYDDAKEVAEYILTKLDDGSEEAEVLLKLSSEKKIEQQIEEALEEDTEAAPQ